MYVWIGERGRQGIHIFGITQVTNNLMRNFSFSRQLGYDAVYLG
jgi:hypothetical protein